jgi:predicted kinase
MEIAMKTKILNWFENNYKQISEDMKICYHNHSNGIVNPFHEENDVWTHTMMVYDNINDNDVDKLFAALLHDIGKIYSRNEKQNGRVSFRLHENISTYKSIDILKHAKNTFYDLNILSTLKLISWHGDLWKNKNIDNVNNREIDLKYGFDYNFYSKFVEFVEADAFGRIYSENHIEEQLNLIDLFKYFKNYIPYNDLTHYNRGNKKEVVCMIGISGSGKSTWIEKNKPNYKIVGVDKYFEEKKSGYDFINYEKNIEKFHILSLKDMKQYIENLDDVVIDMTNVSKEMRRKKLSQFPVTKYHKTGVVFLNGEKSLIENLKKRKEKTIPKEVIEKQIVNFELPSYDEFDEIIYIL